MFLFPAYAGAASRDPDMTGFSPADLDPDDRAIFEESGLDIDQWIDPSGIGGHIRELRAQGAPWRGCLLDFAADIPVFVARCWAVEDLIRTRRTLRRIRRDIETDYRTGGLSNA